MKREAVEDDDSAADLLNISRLAILEIAMRRRDHL
jgi:hypothetical protein